MSSWYSVRGFSAFAVLSLAFAAAAGQSLQQLISIAYGVQNAQIENCPSWSVNLPQHPSPEALRTLLTERFHLSLHRQLKTVPVYYLKALHQRPRLISSGANRNIEIERGRIYASAIHMRDLANALSDVLSRPVIDRSGFTKLFDAHLDFLPDDAVDATGPDASLFNVLEEKLGLRLESANAPIEMLVIDHAEKPAGN